MSDNTVDVLIVGAGASGAAFAWSLLGSRMRILCLEQGPMLSDAAYPSRRPDYELSRYAEFSIDPNVRRLPQDYPINSEASPIAPVNFNAVGGSTINFSAHWPRMHPSDFRTLSLDGVGDDWPVDYATLEPYYATNDRITGSSGLAGNPALSDLRAAASAAPTSANWAGRWRGASIAGAGTGGHRMQRLSAATTTGGRSVSTPAPCDLGCATGAKSSANLTYWPVLLRAGVELRTGCRVREIMLDEHGMASGVLYHDAQGRLQRQRAELVVLACNGIGHAPADAQLDIQPVPRRYC